MLLSGLPVFKREESKCQSIRDACESVQPLDRTPSPPAPLPPQNATKASGAGRPKREWREAVAWLTWICAGLFAALFLVHLARVLSKHCNCCRRRRGADDVEKSILGTSRPRSAALELGKEVRGRHYLSGNADQAPLSQQFRGDARNI